MKAWCKYELICRWSPFSLLCLSSSFLLIKIWISLYLSSKAVPDYEECLWRRFKCRTRLQNLRAAGPDTLFMPWCTRSSHSAALPTVGLSGPLGLGILVISAC